MRRLCPDNLFSQQLPGNGILFWLHYPGIFSHHVKIYLTYIIFINNQITPGSSALLKKPPDVQYSRISQYFIEPEGLVPCSQEPSTQTYQSSPYHSIFLFKINLNAVLPPMSSSTHRSLSLWLSHQNPTSIPLRHHAYYNIYK
jgi:hypothetical protein